MHGSEFFNILLLLLTAALVLSLIAKRFNLPPANYFSSWAGRALALTPNAPTLQIEPELVLTLFRPPLLQASAYFIALA